MRFVIAAGLLAWGVVSAEPSTEELITKLSDSSVEVRRNAARQLGYKVKDPARFAPLEKVATTDPDPTVRLAAFEGLSPGAIDIGKTPKWKALRLKMLKDPDAKVRYEAVRQMRPAEPDTYAAHFSALKTDKDPAVKVLVILSLHDTYAPGLVEVLITMVNDPTESVRRTVISTLGFSKDPRAVPVLIEAAKRGAPGAVNALSSTNDPRAVDPVLEVLATTTNQDAREEAVAAISYSMPDGRAAPRLIELWSRLSKADKKQSTKPQEDPMEDMSDYPRAITAALQAIAAVDQAPCQAAKTAAGDVKAYLKKILPKKCGGTAGGAELGKLVELQVARGGDPASVYTDDASFAIAGASDEPQVARGRIASVVGDGSVTSRSIVVSADGKSASLALVIKVKGVDWRVSELAINTTAGWRIAGGLASVGQDNKAVNAAALANKLQLKALPDAKPDAALAKAFASLTKGPLDASAAARTDLVAFGSGPGERTSGGGVLARAWKSSWSKRVTASGPLVTRVAPSGTTGFVLANITLDKAGKTPYKIPFRVLFVFDKVGAGWSLVHAHFATTAP